MKTLVYNPSPLEVNFAKAVETLTKRIEEILKPLKIISIDKRLKEDNPKLIFTIRDKEGDNHEVVVQIIQRIDEDAL
jgi:hypothetical protein